MGESAAPEIERLRKARREIPDKLLPPILHTGLEFFMQAFYDLATTRVDSAAPISWLSIEHYADRLGLLPDVRQELHHHVRHLDRVFLDHSAKRVREMREKGRKSEDKGRHSQFGSKAFRPPRRGGR